MASTFSGITAAVGIRNGQDMMPNTRGDLQTVTGLFDRIPVRNGGSAEIGGVWATDRDALIQEVTAQIVTFQTVNNLAVIDGVIDRSGNTIRLMNQLAADPPPQPSGGSAATVVDPPGGFSESAAGAQMVVVDVNSMAGLRPLRSANASATYTRHLVRVDNSSIKWFGVVVPLSSTGMNSVVHLNFTPTPIQGHYYDSNYESFAGWAQLWEDYTELMGGQMAACGVDQIMVIPIYRTSQAKNLGNFLSNWKDVVSSVVTAVLNYLDPLQLRDTFTVGHIVSSSFSNGFVAHQQFYGQAAGAAAATDVLFDLDGQAGGSNWRPSAGIIYMNRTAPSRTNPAGNIWYVGGRWDNFAKFYGGNLNTHACCRNHLLFHGLWLACSA
jgi:hypothetical protein